MIRIRTITYNLPEVITDKDYKTIEACSARFSSIDYEVHTQRISCVPCGKFDPVLIGELSNFSQKSGVRWFNLPVDLWKGDAASAEEIRDVLVQNSNAFVNVICAKDAVINSEIINFTAKQFLINAEAASDGLINFRFGASMNVAPNGPFFPFTHSGGKASFSIGLEIAEEINDILESMAVISDINEVKNQIVDVLTPQITEIEHIAENIAADCGIEYAGIDFSLAPLPKDKNSVISIVNLLGVNKIDDTGVLFVTAFLTGLLKQFAKTHKSVGFSGVMYSLIEDQIYAEINSTEGFSIDRMISLSTMCGCGVDMVPIPMDSTLNSIENILLEIACVSSRLKKPLGVRLLPIKSDDGFTHFTTEEDFCFNTRIVRLNSENKLSINGIFCFDA